MKKFVAASDGWTKQDIFDELGPGGTTIRNFRPCDITNKDAQQFVDDAAYARDDLPSEEEYVHRIRELGSALRRKIRNKLKSNRK